MRDERMVARGTALGMLWVLLLVAVVVGGILLVGKMSEAEVEKGRWQAECHLGTSYRQQVGGC